MVGLMQDPGHMTGLMQDWDDHVGASAQQADLGQNICWGLGIVGFCRSLGITGLMQDWGYSIGAWAHSGEKCKSDRFTHIYTFRFTLFGRFTLSDLHQRALKMGFWGGKKRDSAGKTIRVYPRYRHAAGENFLGLKIPYIGAPQAKICGVKPPYIGAPLAKIFLG